MKHWRFLLLIPALALGAPVFAAEEAAHPKKADWEFSGAFGTLNMQQAQRGYQVYKEVCAACHSMDLVAYRNLQELGFSEAETKALAAEKTVQELNDRGEMADRPARPSDAFVAPYPNEQAARAANQGAYPPDLSLIIKARHDGANYVHSLLTGYDASKVKFYSCAAQTAEGVCIQYGEAAEENLKKDRERIAQVEARRLKQLEARTKQAAKQPASAEGAVPVLTPQQEAEDTSYEAAKKPTVWRCISIDKVKNEETGEETESCNELPDNQYFNPYYPGQKIAMPPPLSDGLVSYGDGTEATVEQMSKDVVTFLQWAAEPEMERRKAMGIKAILFLLIATVFFYAAKRKIWRGIH